MDRQIETSGSERIVLSVPLDFSAEEFSELCRIRPDSSAF